MRQPPLLVLLLVSVSCGPATLHDDPPEYPSVATLTPDESRAPQAVTVTAQARPEVANETTLEIRAPREGERIRRGPVMLDLALEGAAPGDVIAHVVVDDAPSITLAELGEPINLTERMEARGGLTEGTHVLRVFLSGSNDESIKAPTALAMTTFHVGEQTDPIELDRDAPLLTYHRPMGCSRSDAPVLLDFHLLSGALSDTLKVRYMIARRGEDPDELLTGEIAHWTPHHIEHLPRGEYSLRLTLVDGAGQQVPGVFNDTTRAFSVAERCD